MYTHSDVEHDDIGHDAEVVAVVVLHGFVDDVLIPHTVEVGHGSVVPADGDGVAAVVLHAAAVERLVDVAQEVCQEHQAYRRINAWSVVAVIVRVSVTRIT